MCLYCNCAMTPRRAPNRLGCFSCRLREMSDATSDAFELEVAAQAKRLPTAANVPGTTLGFIRVPAFPKGAALVDTPGLLIAHSALHAEVPGLAPPPTARRLEGHTLVLEDPRAGQAFEWAGGLVRVHLRDEAGRLEAVTFFGAQPPKVLVEGADSQPLAPRPGFQVHTLIKKVDASGARHAAALADLAVSGIAGWIQIVGRGPTRVHATVQVPTGVHVFWRPPLPTVY